MKRAKRRDLSADLKHLRETGEARKVDVNKLYLVEAPLPHERAVLILSTALGQQIVPEPAATPWACQVEAAAFFNEHGLSKTLDRILELSPQLLEST